MTGAPAFLYESFPAASFGGNIAGVVLLEHRASRSWMQGVTADLGAPTTGFVDLPSARQGRAEVRFFTPHREIDACGHVTVAIATALAQTGPADARPVLAGDQGGAASVRFRSDGVDPSTGMVPDGGIDAECRQALANLASMLKAAGANLPDVVKATIFYTGPDDLAGA